MSSNARFEGIPEFAQSKYLIAFTIFHPNMICLKIQQLEMTINGLDFAQKTARLQTDADNGSKCALCPPWPHTQLASCHSSGGTLQEGISMNWRMPRCLMRGSVCGTETVRWLADPYGPLEGNASCFQDSQRRNAWQKA